MEEHHPSISILVVEDNDPTQRLIRHWLQKEFDVDITNRIEKALKLVADRHFDLLILDINLGQDYTGVDLLEMIRNRPGYAQTPAIAFTAYALPQDRHRLIEQGFDNYLCKPFTRVGLFDAIRATLHAREIA